MSLHTYLLIGAVLGVIGSAGSAVLTVRGPRFRPMRDRAVASLGVIVTDAVIALVMLVLTCITTAAWSLLWPVLIICAVLKYGRRTRS